MSPKHPLSRRPQNNNLHFWGAGVLLILLALSIRWARNPAPVRPPQGFSPPPAATYQTSAPIVPQVLPQTGATPYVPVVASLPVSIVASTARVLPAYWKMAANTPPVNAILKAPNGLVWAATEGGLVQIDGNKVSTLSRNNGFFPVNSATCLAHDGVSLWIGTFEGLFQTLDGRSFKKYQKADGLAHDMVWSLEWDAPNRVLWIGTQEGFSFMTPDGRLERVDKKISNGGLADLWIGSIKKIDRWALCGNDDGLSIWDTGSMAANPKAWVTLDMFTSNLAHNWILSMAVIDGKLWVGTPLGLCRLETAVQSLFTGLTSSWKIFTKPTLPSSRVDAIVPAGNDVWIGTPEGLTRLRHETPRTFRYAEGLLASDVRALAATPEGLWVGTSVGIQSLDLAQVN